MLQSITLLLSLSLINQFAYSNRIFVEAETPKPVELISLNTSNSNQQAYYLNLSRPANNSYQLELAEKARIELEAKLAQEAQAAETARINEQARLRQLKIKQSQVKKKAAPQTNQASAPSRVPNNVDTGYAYERVLYWASVYGVDPGMALKIGYCESGLRANAVGGGGLYGGIYQQHRKYWAGRAAAAGIPGGDIFNADHNIRVSLFMMRNYGMNHWPSCSK